MQRTRTSLIIFILLAAVGVGTIHAQDAGKVYTIGYLAPTGLDAFKEEMENLGYVEGTNINYMTMPVVDLPFDQYLEVYNTHLQEMIDAGVDVLVPTTDSEAVGFRDRSGDIPVVFQLSDDPVATGAVASLLSPGGNITGSITNQPHERRLQILTEIKPTTKKIVYLYSAMTADADAVLQDVIAVAEQLNVEIIPAAQTMDPASTTAMLENIPDDVDWLFMTPYVFLDPAGYERLMAQAVAHKAGISGVTADPVQGFVVTYGPDFNAAARQAADTVDRILRGASPADLPVQTLDNYLSINLEAAQAIDLPVPQGILRQSAIIARPGYFETHQSGYAA